MSSMSESKSYSYGSFSHEGTACFACHASHDYQVGDGVDPGIQHVFRFFRGGDLQHVTACQDRQVDLFQDAVQSLLEHDIRGLECRHFGPAAEANVFQCAQVQLDVQRVASRSSPASSSSDSSANDSDTRAASWRSRGDWPTQVPSSRTNAGQPMAARRQAHRPTTVRPTRESWGLRTCAASSLGHP